MPFSSLFLLASSLSRELTRSSKLTISPRRPRNFPEEGGNSKRFSIPSFALVLSSHTQLMMFDKMDPQITLTTSDIPAISHTISRSALVAQSTVFADMLSLDLKSEDGDTSIPLTEKASEVSTMITLLESTEDVREGTLKQLTCEGWISLARMADKYDCWSLRKLVEANAWYVFSLFGVYRG